ncbi:hypothetical protein J6590_069405 [Homalodisca vitripennis]|nr:hypothetical protein J6590_069405 [Homalodisca vitripennis]
MLSYDAKTSHYTLVSHHYSGFRHTRAKDQNLIPVWPLSQGIICLPRSNPPGPSFIHQSSSAIGLHQEARVGARELYVEMSIGPATALINRGNNGLSHDTITPNVLGNQY